MLPLESFSPNIRAEIVWDGQEITIPACMLFGTLADSATPADRQCMQTAIEASGKMQGTLAERLSELAGRVCYDSLLGKGRTSEDYHKHIAQVGHTSVWGHFHATHVFQPYPYGFHELLGSCANRPGVWAAPQGNGVRITANLRAVAEWAAQTDALLSDCPAFRGWRECMDYVGACLQAKYHTLAPRIISRPTEQAQHAADCSVSSGHPKGRAEKWITAYIHGSRGLTHELVRHGWQTGISQRSTRFCDETESLWIEHPAITTYDHARRRNPALRELFKSTNPGACPAHDRYVAREVYAPMVEQLQAWFVSRGVDALTARKQARGAARGYLGNALSTEVIFSASVAQWRRILVQRCHPAADAEIRVLAARLLGKLRTCEYGSDFADMELTESPDVIGPHLRPGTRA